MHRSKSGRRFPVAAAAGAFCACVAVLAAPRFAAAALVPQSESHTLSALSTIDGVTNDQVVPGSTSSPVSPITAEAAAPGTSGSSLNLAFDGGSISSSLRGFTGTGFTLPQTYSLGGSGNFSITFSVPQPTPFTLGGTISATGRLPQDIGSASVRLTEDTTPLFARDTSFTLIPGVPVPVDASGTLLPGRTYTLTGAASNAVTNDALGQPRGGESRVDVTLTVPEPASLALLAPAGLLVLGRRRRI